MNKKIKLMQLFIMFFGLWCGQSQGMQGQTPFGTNPYGAIPQPSGYGAPQYPVKFNIQQPQLNISSNQTQSYQSQQITPIRPVSPVILSHIQTLKSQLWALYQQAPRINSQFSQQDWDAMVNDVKQIQNLADMQMNDRMQGNVELRDAANKFVNLFKSPNIYITKNFVQSINDLSEIHNRILANNQRSYSPDYSQLLQMETPISPEAIINLPSTSVPLAVRGQQAVTGKLYDWTKPVIEPIGSVVQTGWEYAKRFGGGIASGAQGAWGLAFPTEERINLLKAEIALKKEELLIKESINPRNEVEIAQLRKDIIDKEYLLGSLTGWTPWLARAALLGAAVGTYKSGAIGATASGLLHGGTATIKGGAQLGAGAVRGTYNYLKGE